MKKLLCVSLSLLLMLSMLTACAAKPQDFSWNGLTVTLDSSFKTLESTTSSASFASYLKMYVVVISYETFEELENTDLDSQMSASDYARIVMELNEFEGEPVTKDGITYYNYTGMSDDTEFTYMATIHRVGNAYWTVTFASQTSDYDAAEPQFLSWAKTVSYAEVTA